ncbi:MAG: hypothetical protein AABX35_04775 [Nanoarchaeota archaeon]
MDRRAFEIEARRKNLTDMFLQLVSEDESFKLAQKTVRDSRNTAGPRYLVGSFIYKTLIRNLYKPTLERPKEINYVVDRHVQKHDMVIPDRWKIKGNDWGVPQLCTADRGVVTITTFNSFHFIRDGQSAQRIGSYFNNVPFNLNGIAFDLQSDRIIGKQAINGISEGIFRLSNPEAVKLYVRKNGINNIDEYARYRAESFGLKYVTSE